MASRWLLMQSVHMAGQPAPNGVFQQAPARPRICVRRVIECCEPSTKLRRCCAPARLRRAAEADARTQTCALCNFVCSLLLNETGPLELTLSLSQLARNGWKANRVEERLGGGASTDFCGGRQPARLRSAAGLLVLQCQGNSALLLYISISLWLYLSVSMILCN